MTSPESVRKKWEKLATFLLVILQICSILAGGVWTYFLFSRFDSVERTLKNDHDKIELEKMKAKPLEYAQSLEKWNGGSSDSSSELGVAYHYSVRNTTNSRLTISKIVISTFTLPTQNLGIQAVKEMPSLNRNDKNDSWRQVLCKYYLASGQQDTDPPTFLGAPVLPAFDVGFVSDLEPGETNWETYTIFLRPKGIAFIGFRLELWYHFSDDPSNEKTAELTIFDLPEPGKTSGSANAVDQH